MSIMDLMPWFIVIACFLRRSISERTISIFLAREEHPEHGGVAAGGAAGGATGRAAVGAAGGAADVGMAIEGRGVWFLSVDGDVGGGGLTEPDGV